MPAKTDLEHALLERVSRDLARHGFKLVKAERTWRKKTPAATFAFHLAIVHHPGDFDVLADLAVRLEAAAAVLEDALGGRDAAAKTVGRFTLGVEIGNLTIGEPRRWTVTAAADIEPVAESLIEAFETIALPYYREFSDPERALAVLSGDSRDSWLHSPLHHIRAIRTMALAFLLGRREEFECLAERKRAFLAVSRDLNAQRNLPVFDHVVEQLRRRWGASNSEEPID